MWSRPEPLDLSCPKCSADVVLEIGDDGADPMRCPQCGFRLDLDPRLLDSAWAESWPDDADVRAR